MYLEKFEKIKWSQNFDFSTQKLIYLHLIFFLPKKLKMAISAHFCNKIEILRALLHNKL